MKKFDICPVLATKTGRPVFDSRFANQRLFSRQLSSKKYELKDHLGNVRALVSDKKIPNISGTVFSPDVLSHNNYYPFGMEITGLSGVKIGEDGYRYGFNGKEKDDSGEWGSEAIYDYGFRIYNPAIAKFLSVDPLTKSYPMLTPYQFASNRPINGIDLDGLEFMDYRQLKFWYDFSSTIANGVADVIIYAMNNPNHAGYDINAKRPPTQAELDRYAVDWSKQLDPYYQIESFSRGIVNTGIGVYEFGEGVTNLDGKQAAESLPEVAGAIGGLLTIRRPIPNPYRIVGKKWSGTVYRYDKPTRIDGTWDVNEFNIDANHRYSSKGNGARYSSTTAETAAAAVSYQTGSLGGRTLVSRNVTLNNALDLTNADVRKKLNLSLEDITSEGYDLTQQLGDMARNAGYDGIIAPSAANPTIIL